MKKEKGYYKQKWLAIPKHTRVFIGVMSGFIALALVLLLIISFLDFRNGGVAFTGYFTFWNWLGSNYGLFLIIILLVIVIAFTFWFMVKKGGIGK